MAIKYRCFRCMKVLRADGTCQNPKCIRYVPDEETPVSMRCRAIIMDLVKHRLMTKQR